MHRERGCKKVPLLSLRVRIPMCRIAPQTSPESKSIARLFDFEEDWMKYLENGEYLCAVEISTKQNYNMIDGKCNNMETPKEAKPGKDKISLLERMKENQQLLISGARKEDKEKKNERDLP